MEGVGKGTLAPFEFPFLSLWGKRGTPRKNDLQKIENKFLPATEKFKICCSFLCRSLKKGKGLNYPQVYSHWSSPLEVPQLIGRDVTLSLFPIGPKSPSITGSSELPLKSAMAALEFSTDHFFLASDWFPPSPRPFFSRSAKKRATKGEPAMPR